MPPTRPRRHSHVDRVLPTDTPTVVGGYADGGAGYANRDGYDPGGGHADGGRKPFPRRGDAAGYCSAHGYADAGEAGLGVRDFNVIRPGSEFDTSRSRAST